MAAIDSRLEAMLAPAARSAVSVFVGLLLLQVGLSNFYAVITVIGWANSISTGRAQTNNNRQQNESVNFFIHEIDNQLRSGINDLPVQSLFLLLLKEHRHDKVF